MFLNQLSNNCHMDNVPVSLFLMVIFTLFDGIFAEINLPPNAQWNQNAVTVAGSSTGSAASTLSTLDMCSGIFMDNDDTLFVTDTGNRRIVLVKPNSTRAVSVIQYNQSNNYLFSFPTDISVTQNYIYVLDADRSHVLRFLKNRTNPVVFAGITDYWAESMNTSGFGTINNIFVDNQEQLYVSDGFRSIIIRYASNSTSGSAGVIVAGNGTYGSDSTQLSWPQGIFVDTNGTLYVADAWNHRIQKWTHGASTGVTVAGTGEAGSSLSELDFPMMVILDIHGYMYILDNNNHRVLRWRPNSASGECIAACDGDRGVTNSFLGGPTSITFDRFGSLFVSDQANNRVQKFAILNTTTGMTATSTSITTTVSRSTSTRTSSVRGTTSTSTSSVQGTTSTSTSSVQGTTTMMTTTTASNSSPMVSSINTALCFLSFVLTFRSVLFTS